MEIPFRSLPEDTLTAVIEDYITREGTEYGERDYSLEEKVEQVKKQLEQGKILITFDPETETCTLTPAR
jgi:uncharacterized protein YheU (UPF0270 family)